MSQILSDVGIRISEDSGVEELRQLIAMNRDSLVFMNSGSTGYCVLHAGKLELWFQCGPDGEPVPESVSPKYITDFEYDIIGTEWLRRDDDGAGGLLRGWTEFFPMNIYVPDAALCPGIGEDGVSRCALAAFAEHISAYSDSDDFRENCEYGDGYEESTFIPTGCYEAFGKDSVAQSEKAFMSGMVLESKLIENPLTGDEYLYSVIDCNKKLFGVLAEPELFFDTELPLKKGSIVIGSFRLNGTLVREMYKG